MNRTDNINFTMCFPYRFGFNGKEKDDEISGTTGSHYNYGFREYDSRIGRFWSVDPLASDFPELTPYQFASNTPIWAVDLDGLEARIYSDLSALPHSFISVIDDEGIINVYTFGQYMAGSSGEGVGSPFSYTSALIHYKGDAANEYIRNEYKNYTVSSFEISKEKVDKNKIIDYFDSEMSKYNKVDKGRADVFDILKNYPESGSSASFYKPYWAIPTQAGTTNCTGVVIDALFKGGVNLLGVFPLPWLVDLNLFGKSLFSNDYKDVTGDSYVKAANNENGTIYYGGQIKEIEVNGNQ